MLTRWAQKIVLDTFGVHVDEAIELQLAPLRLKVVNGRSAEWRRVHGVNLLASFGQATLGVSGVAVDELTVHVCGAEPPPGDAREFLKAAAILRPPSAPPSDVEQDEDLDGPLSSPAVTAQPPVNDIHNLLAKWLASLLESTSLVIRNLLVVCWDPNLQTTLLSATVRKAVLQGTFSPPWISVLKFSLKGVSVAVGEEDTAQLDWARGYVDLTDSPLGDVETGDVTMVYGGKETLDAWKALIPTRDPAPAASPAPNESEDSESVFYDAVGSLDQIARDSPDEPKRAAAIDVRIRRLKVTENELPIVIVENLGAVWSATTWSVTAGKVQVAHQPVRLHQFGCTWSPHTQVLKIHDDLTIHIIPTRSEQPYEPLDLNFAVSDIEYVTSVVVDSCLDGERGTWREGTADGAESQANSSPLVMDLGGHMEWIRHYTDFEFQTGVFHVEFTQSDRAWEHVIDCAGVTFQTRKLENSRLEVGQLALTSKSQSVEIQGFLDRSEVVIDVPNALPRVRQGDWTAALEDCEFRDLSLELKESAEFASAACHLRQASDETQDLLRAATLSDRLRIGRIQGPIPTRLHVQDLDVQLGAPTLSHLLSLIDPPEGDTLTNLKDCRMEVMVDNSSLRLGGLFDVSNSNTELHLTCLAKTLKLDHVILTDTTLACDTEVVCSLQKVRSSAGQILDGETATCTDDCSSRPCPTVMSDLKVAFKNSQSITLLAGAHEQLMEALPPAWRDFVESAKHVDAESSQEDISKSYKWVEEVSGVNYDVRPEDVEHTCVSHAASGCNKVLIEDCCLKYGSAIQLELSNLRLGPAGACADSVRLKDLNPMSKFEYIIQCYHGEHSSLAFTLFIDSKVIDSRTPIPTDLVDVGEHKAQTDSRPSSSPAHRPRHVLKEYSIHLNLSRYLLTLDFDTLMMLLDFYFSETQRRPSSESDDPDWSQREVYDFENERQTPRRHRLKTKLKDRLKSGVHNRRLQSFHCPSNAAVSRAQTDKPVTRTQSALTPGSGAPSFLVRKFCLSGFDLIVQVNPQRRSVGLSTELAAVNSVMHVLARLNQLRLTTLPISLEGLMDVQQLSQRLTRQLTCARHTRMIFKQLFFSLPFTRLYHTVASKLHRTHPDEKEQAEQIRRLREIICDSAYDEVEDYLDAVQQQLDTDNMDYEEVGPVASRPYAASTLRLSHWLEQYTRRSVKKLMRNRESIVKTSMTLMTMITLDSLNCGSTVLQSSLVQNTVLGTTNLFRSALIRSSRNAHQPPDICTPPREDWSGSSASPPSSAWNMVNRGADDFYQPETFSEGLELAGIKLKRGFKDMFTLADEAATIESIAYLIPAVIVTPLTAITSALESAIQGARNTLDPETRAIKLTSLKRPTTID